jgi:hypothetical protein
MMQPELETLAWESAFLMMQPELQTHAWESAFLMMQPELEISVQDKDMDMGISACKTWILTFKRFQYLQLLEVLAL